MLQEAGRRGRRPVQPGRPRSPIQLVVMQKFQSNLLICFALGLCALCAFQWVRESRLRREIAELHRTVYLKLDTIQNLERRPREDAGDGGSQVEPARPARPAAKPAAEQPEPDYDDLPF